MEREYLERESTLVVTVRPAGEFHEDVGSAIRAMDREEHVESTPTIAFRSYDDLLETLTPRTLDLIEAVRREEPTSINQTARVVDRDVKNVHEELSRLARLGIIYFEETGREKRPIVWFDELRITLPFDTGDASPARTAT